MKLSKRGAGGVIALQGRLVNGLLRAMLNLEYALTDMHRYRHSIFLYVMPNCPLANSMPFALTA